MGRDSVEIIEELRTIYGLKLVDIGRGIKTDPRTVGTWARREHVPNERSRRKINKLYREVKAEYDNTSKYF